MANANTVRQQVVGTIQLTLAPLLAATIGTTKTAFQLNNNAISLTGGGVIPIAAGVTGLYQGTGRTLKVSATGTIVGTTSTTVILELYEVPASVIAAGLTATSFTNWNGIKTSSTRTLGQTIASWNFDARVQLDAGGNLTGSATDTIDSQLDIYAQFTAITGLTGEADLNFAVVATFGGSGAVSITMDEFRIDLE